IDLSLSKIIDLINLIEEKEYDWKRENIIDNLNKINGQCKEIYGYYKLKSLNNKLLLKIKEINKHVQKIESFIN
ncbi:hypothetical protein D6777_03700, partial [Candidatus Woesearchaeota archaeon]